jgi:hypothetical protein
MYPTLLICHGRFYPNRLQEAFSRESLVMSKRERDLHQGLGVQAGR